MNVKKVLLIEDDEITTFLNQAVIENTGVKAQLIFATNGQEGLDYLQSLPAEDHYPNLILMDWNMPVLNGHGFLAEYQKLPMNKKAATKVVVLSTSTQQSDLKEMEQFGISMFLEKPLTTNAFLDVVKELDPDTVAN